MKILKVDRWALSLNSVKYWFILPTSEVLLFLALDWTPKGIPWVWRHMRGFLKSRCDSHAPSLNKFTSFGESFLRLYCSVRYVIQLKGTFHVCPCIPTYISRLKFAFATLPAQLPALKLRHQNDHIQNEPPGSRFNTRDGSIREMGL